MSKNSCPNSIVKGDALTTPCTRRLRPSLRRPIVTKKERGAVAWREYHNIAFVAEQLIELLSIRPMRAFHFAVQLGRTALDVGVADAKILDMPMEFRLELMAIVRCPAVDCRGINERAS